MKIVNNRRQRWEDRWASADFRPFWLTEAVPEPLLRAFEAGYFRSGETLLEIGCGRGELAAFCTSRGMAVTATDCADSAIDRAREYAGDMASDIVFERIDFCEEVPAAAPFQCALDRGCLHSIPPALKASYVRNLARCLVPGGHFLLMHKSDKANAPNRQNTAEVQETVAAYFAEDFDILATDEMRFGDGADSIPGFALTMQRRMTD